MTNVGAILTNFRRTRPILERFRPISGNLDDSYGVLGLVRANSNNSGSLSASFCDIGQFWGDSEISAKFGPNRGFGPISDQPFPDLGRLSKSIGRNRPHLVNAGQARPTSAKPSIGRFWLDFQWFGPSFAKFGQSSANVRQLSNEFAQLWTSIE